MSLKRKHGVKCDDNQRRRGGPEPAQIILALRMFSVVYNFPNTDRHHARPHVAIRLRLPKSLKGKALLALGVDG